MTTDPDPLRPDDEARLTELFSVLKQFQPSLDAQAEFRGIVAGELSRRQENLVHPQNSWGKRLLAAAWPFGLGLAVGVAGMLTFNGPRAADDPPRANRPVAAPETSRPVEPPTRGGSPKQPILDHYSTVTYLCGIGQLNSTTMYVVREESHD